MSTRIQNASRSAACDAIVDRLDAGSGPGYVNLYTGTQPTDPDDAPTGTLLATITLNDPAFGVAVDGVATCDVSPALTEAAITSGAAEWFRAFDSDDNAILDGSVTTSGGGGDMVINTTALVQDVNVTVNSWTVVMPAVDPTP